jgi:nicotinamide-nucleotide amidase
MKPDADVSQVLPSADSVDNSVDSGQARARELLHVLGEKGATIGTAESLTGGLVCAELTAIPGSSACVVGSVISYATHIKHQLLGVDADVLARQGAVSAQVAEQMAVGIRELLGCDYGVATTGVAGPELGLGGTDRGDVRVGEVYIASVGPQGCWVEELHLTGSRAVIRQETVWAALSLVTRQVRQDRLNEA